MIKKTSKLFIRCEVDNRERVICVFDVNVTNEQMIEVISKYLEEHEMDEDDEYAPIKSKEDCNEYAKRIVEGETIDFDIDIYFLEVDVLTYTNREFKF